MNSVVLITGALTGIGRATAIGFARDGAEYVTILGPGQSTPAPWINVIANPAFGFQSGTEGGGYTWSINSRENQITPWKRPD